MKMTGEELADWLDDKAKWPGRRIYLSKQACRVIREAAHRVRNCASWYDGDRGEDCDTQAPAQTEEKSDATT